jgi:hypothetical protein
MTCFVRRKIQNKILNRINNEKKKAQNTQTNYYKQNINDVFHFHRFFDPIEMKSVVTLGLSFEFLRHHTRGFPNNDFFFSLPSKMGWSLSP